MAPHLGETPVKGPLRLAGPVNPNPDTLIPRRMILNDLLNDRVFLVLSGLP